MIFGVTPILSVIRNFLEVASFCVLFLCLDRPRYTWKRTWIYYGIYILVETAIGTAWVLLDAESYSAACTTVLFVKSAIFFILMSSDNIFQCLYNLCLQIFILFFMLFTGLSCTKIFFAGNPWVDVGIRFCYMIVLVCIYIRWLRRAYREIADNLKTQWKGLCIVSLGGNILMVYYATQPLQISLRAGREQVLFLCICILLLLTHVILLYTLHLMQLEIIDRQEMELTAINNEMMRKELDLLQEQVESARRYHHDSRHHDLMVAEYVRRGEVATLLAYLDQREKEYREELPERICENKTVDNILGIYIRQAEHKGIEVSCDVIVPGMTRIQDRVFVTVIGNAMENAIHGCEQTGSGVKKIAVFIRPKAGKLAIRISNTCLGEVVFNKGIPVRKNGRGTGILSIMHSVRSCEGDVEFSVEKGEFTTRILLKI